MRILVRMSVTTPMQAIQKLELMLGLVLQRTRGRLLRLRNSQEVQNIRRTDCRQQIQMLLPYDTVLALLRCWLKAERYILPMVVVTRKEMSGQNSRLPIQLCLTIVLWQWVRHMAAEGMHIAMQMLKCLRIVQRVSRKCSVAQRTQISPVMSICSSLTVRHWNVCSVVTIPVALSMVISPSRLRRAVASLSVLVLSMPVVTWHLTLSMAIRKRLMAVVSMRPRTQKI